MSGFDANVLFDISEDEYEILKGLRELAKKYGEWDGAEDVPFEHYLVAHYEEVKGVKGVDVLPRKWVYAQIEYQKGEAK